MQALKEVISYFRFAKYKSSPGVYRATDRSEVNARLVGWSKDFESSGAAPVRAALLVAVIGELANNSFDHNLGKWKDLPGCLVGIDVLNDRFRISIADRGQGIANSLRRVKPGALNNDELLRVAFEERVSGRSPERRGNGLKFIRKNFIEHGGLSLVCLSSSAIYKLGDELELVRILSPISDYAGTLTCIDWSRS